MVRIRIPKTYDRVMDWCSVHFLPPDIPVRGLRLFGYQVTWTDLGVVAWGTLIALAAVWAYGDWKAFIGAWFCLILAWIWMGK